MGVGVCGCGYVLLLTPSLKSKYAIVFLVNLRKLMDICNWSWQERWNTLPHSITLHHTHSQPTTHHSLSHTRYTPTPHPTHFHITPHYPIPHHTLSHITHTPKSHHTIPIPHHTLSHITSHSPFQPTPLET